MTVVVAAGPVCGLFVMTLLVLAGAWEDPECDDETLLDPPVDEGDLSGQSEADPKELRRVRLPWG